MSFFSTLKTALSLKEKLAATGVLVLICALLCWCWVCMGTSSAKASHRENWQS